MVCFSPSQMKSRILRTSCVTANITLFVPPTFNGTFTVYSKHGKVQFLPAFAAKARTVHADDKSGQTMLFGGEELLSMPCEPTGEGLDYCSVRTDHGKVIIGISGVDQLDVDDTRSGPCVHQ